MKYKLKLFIRFYIDDTEIFTYSKEANANQSSWPFDDEFNIIINTAIGGNWVIFLFLLVND